jgi:sugar transferase (PEP-CTERM/EpsH1 system associated)
MRDLLFLAHRIPYPPDKGEKIRAWHMLRQVARTHRVHLGCFIDDPDDWAHLPALREVCADVACFGLDRRRQRLRALLRVRPGLPLSVAYFDDARLRRWVAGKCATGINRSLIYCSAMAPYVADATGMRRLLDMVDIDSEKWRDYASASAWPLRAVWAREARTLLAFERRMAACFERTVLVSRAEAARFRELAPECGDQVGWIDNGVDSEFFAPGEYPDPYPPGGPVYAFTGTMDYRPNVDAAGWFVREVMPLLRKLGLGIRLAIVGASPAPAVRALAAADVLVTGRVADMRPYLAHAAAAVAPLRIARGIQNKVLEAMAMGRPVVVSPQAFAGIEARAGHELLVADDAPAFASCLGALASGEHAGMGAAARRAVVGRYAWSSVLAGLDALLDESTPQPAAAVAGQLMAVGP